MSLTAARALAESRGIVKALTMVGKAPSLSELLPVCMHSLQKAQEVYQHLLPPSLGWLPLRQVQTAEAASLSDTQSAISTVRQQLSQRSPSTASMTVSKLWAQVLQIGGRCVQAFSCMTIAGKVVTGGVAAIVVGGASYQLFVYLKEKTRAPYSTSSRFSAAAPVLAEPGEHVCPITQQPFVDPVITADGHTYERLAIELWLQDHDTSPMTGLSLPSKALIPNLALRTSC